MLRISFGLRSALIAMLFVWSAGTIAQPVDPPRPPLPNVKAPQPHCRPNMLGEWFSSVDRIHEVFGSLTITPDALIFGRQGRFGFTRRTTPGGHPYLELDRNLKIEELADPDNHFVKLLYPGTWGDFGHGRCLVDVLMCFDAISIVEQFDITLSLGGRCYWFTFSQPSTGAIN